MTATQPLQISTLVHQFQTCSRLQFNGKLEICNRSGQQWSFYYRLGRIVCATGGTHSVRRWQRQMKKFCPLVDLKNSQFREIDLAPENWDYQVLKILRQRQQINMEQIASVVEGIISELMFDVIQQSVSSPLACRRNEDDVLDSPLFLSRRGFFIQQIEKSWPAWCEAGLTEISPNLAPILRNPSQLKQQVNPAIYKNFVTLINGKSTLRDLAIRMKQDVRILTRSLLPYIQKGWVELITIGDLPMPDTYDSVAYEARSIHEPTGELIVCIDDSPQVCQILEQILTSAGFRCITIQDSLKALPTLIEQKPSLILLDLVMPVANGYEICSQLRRISSFAKTPIVILSGNDGIVDRVRAKVVGASDFLNKPIDAEKVVALVHKYLSEPSASGNLEQLSLSPIS